MQVGCGGLCGSINLSLSNASGCLPAMNGEFVVAATDMGHHGSMMDASWAEDPQKRIDFARRANHLTAVLAKAVMQTLYRQPPKYAYFMGCSDGGREALMEAQRFPQDFDGISAGAPAAFFQFQNSFFHGWNVAANQRPDGTAILLKNRLPLIHQPCWLTARRFPACRMVSCKIRMPVSSLSHGSPAVLPMLGIVLPA